MNNITIVKGTSVIKETASIEEATTWLEEALVAARRINLPNWYNGATIQQAGIVVAEVVLGQIETR